MIRSLVNNLPLYFRISFHTPSLRGPQGRGNPFPFNLYPRAPRCASCVAVSDFSHFRSSCFLSAESAARSRAEKEELGGAVPTVKIRYEDENRVRARDLYIV